MANIKFEIIKRIGIISETTNNSLQLNLVSWNNGKPKYDLRKWGNDGQKPYKGCTFSQSELVELCDILINALSKEKSKIVKYNTSFGRATASIYEVIGEYKNSKSMPGKVTYTSWGGSPKYDIRPWNEDFSVCGKGVSLNDAECSMLLNLIKKECNLNSDEEYDTSSIDDVLLL